MLIYIRWPDLVYYECPLVRLRLNLVGKNLVHWKPIRIHLAYRRLLLLDLVHNLRHAASLASSFLRLDIQLRKLCRQHHYDRYDNSLHVGQLLCGQ